MPAKKEQPWRTRREAAKDLSALLGERITGATVQSWARDPTTDGILPRGRGPIPRAPLIAWARTMRRRPGRQRGGSRRGPPGSPAIPLEPPRQVNGHAARSAESEADIARAQAERQRASDEANRRWTLEVEKLNEEVRKLRNHNLDSERQRLKSDEVMAEITRATTSLKDWLLGALPAQAYDLSFGQERLPALERIRQVLIDQLNAWADSMDHLAGSPIAPVEPTVNKVAS